MNFKNIKHIISDYYIHLKHKTPDERFLGDDTSRDIIKEHIENLYEQVEFLSDNSELKDISNGQINNFNWDIDEINEHIEIASTISNDFDQYISILTDFINDTYGIDERFEDNEILKDQLEILSELKSDIKNRFEVFFKENKDIKITLNSNIQDNINDLNDQVEQYPEVESELQSSKSAYDSAEIENDDYERREYEEAKEIFESLSKCIEELADDIHSEFSTFSENNEFYYDFLVETFDFFNDEIEGIFDELKDLDPTYLQNLAERTYYEVNKYPEKIVFNQQNFDDKILFSYHHQDKHFMIFDDLSILEKKDNEYHILDNEPGNHSLKDRYPEIINSFIEYTNRKHPLIGKYIKQKFSEERSSLSSLVDLNEYILDKKSLLKHYSVDIHDFFDKKSEVLYDKIQEVEELHKIDSFYNRQFSGKYKSLKSDNLKNTIRDWFNAGLTEDVFKEYISRKIAYYLNKNSPEELIENINQTMTKYSDWSAEAIKLKLGEVNIPQSNILAENRNIVVKIDNYDQCKALGSSSWCIQRSSGMYNNYKNENNEFFIYYDFTKKAEDPNSQIGFHLIKEDKEFVIKSSHLKNDNLTPTDKKNEILDTINHAFFDKYFDKKKKIHKNKP